MRLSEELNLPRHASGLKNRVGPGVWESVNTYVDTKIPDEVLFFVAIGRSGGASPRRDVRRC